MSTHATTKFRWWYLKKDGTNLDGAFIVPIGEEQKAKDWLQKIVSGWLEKDEEYDPNSSHLEEIGDDGKIR